VSAARHSPTPSTASAEKAIGFSMAAKAICAEERSCTPLTAAQMWPAAEAMRERVADTMVGSDACNGKTAQQVQVKGAAELSADLGRGAH
jgi:hypothetical protein